MAGKYANWPRGMDLPNTFDSVAVGTNEVLSGEGAESSSSAPHVNSSSLSWSWVAKVARIFFFCSALYALCSK